MFEDRVGDGGGRVFIADVVEGGAAAGLPKVRVEIPFVNRSALRVGEVFGLFDSVETGYARLLRAFEYRVALSAYPPCLAPRGADMSPCDVPKGKRAAKAVEHESRRREQHLLKETLDLLPVTRW